jgi:signal transduction histidine kinase
MPDVPQEAFSLPGNPARVIVRLNLEYIQKEFIPALVHSHLASTKGEYHLQIRKQDDGSQVIYSSEPGTSIQGEGDASEGILSLRLDDFRNIAPAEEPFTAAVPGTRVDADRVFSVHVMPGVFGMAHMVHGEHFSGLNSNTWRVTAVHRAGSLDAAVAQLRRRNLAISFSILALLSASVAIVLISSARAQRLAQQQMEFVSAVSHELRTPLAVICSAGENLADGLIREADQLKSYGKVVRNEGRRLTEMVEQILSFTGIESGLKKQTFVPVDVGRVVERAVRAFESPIRENGFIVESHIAPELPPVMGDSFSLTRAVQNLVSNAIKYSGAGRWIGVSAFADGRWVKIAVQDRGSGTPSADLPHIFEPFYRGRSAVEGQVQGSGLGLSLVKQAVDAHGGRIDVASNHGDGGDGSTFCISLPMASPPEASTT